MRKESGKRLYIRKLFMLALVLALAFSLCSCGKDEGDDRSLGNRRESKEQSSGGKHQESGTTVQTGTGNGGGTDSKLPASATQQSTETSTEASASATQQSTETSTEAPASATQQTTAASTDAAVNDRHYYKTVVFYGFRHHLMAEMDSSGSANGDYQAAVVFDYDTNTGDVIRARVVQYYEVSGISGETGEKATARNKEQVVKYNNYALCDRPYTEEFFTYIKGSSDQKMCAMTWELELDETAYLLDQNIAFYFSGKVYGTGKKQDIDGFIRAVFYDQLQGARIRPLACFADNGFRSTYSDNRAEYTVCWYDTEWSVEMKDEIYGIASRLTLEDNSEPFTVEEYGTTNYNTGGGYTGTYDYRKYMR